jgi:hypothetical protein
MKIRYLSILALLFLLIAVFSEYFTITGRIEKLNASAIQKLIHHKELRLDEYNKKLYERLKKEKIAQVKQYNRLYDEEGIVYFVFEQDSLIYWSNNNIPINNYEILKLDDRIIRLQNGYYYLKSIQYNEYLIAGLLLVKHEFVYQNKFLKNEFQEDFNFPDETRISLNQNEGVTINSLNGEFLFSIIECTEDCNNSGFVFPFIAFVGFFLVLFFLGNEILNRKKHLYWLLIPTYTLFLFLLKFLMLFFQYPRSFYLLP